MSAATAKLSHSAAGGWGRRPSARPERCPQCCDAMRACTAAMPDPLSPAIAGPAGNVGDDGEGGGEADQGQRQTPRDAGLGNQAIIHDSAPCGARQGRQHEAGDGGGKQRDEPGIGEGARQRHDRRSRCPPARPARTPAWTRARVRPGLAAVFGRRQLPPRQPPTRSGRQALPPGRTAHAAPATLRKWAGRPWSG